MKRKVISLAPNTYVVTLPLRWANKHDIKKGDEVDMAESADKLIISSNSSAASKSAMIDISLLNERVVRWYLSALHKSGYDLIEIKHNGQAQQKLVYELMKNLFTGFNIISETPNSIILKSIANENKEEFDNSLRRAFRITLQMGDELLEAIKLGKILNHETIALIKEKELQNNQLTNFCQRLISKYNYGGDKAVFLYAIIWNLEKVCDNYKYIADAFEKYYDLAPNASRKSVDKTSLNISQEMISLIKESNQYLEDYYTLFYKFNITMLNNISQKKTALTASMTEFKPSSDIERVILNHILVFVTQVTDFSASMKQLTLFFSG